MSNTGITHACVFFPFTGKKPVVPVSSVADFNPKNETDFVKNRKYKVRVERAAKGHVWLNAYVLLLGGKLLIIFLFFFHMDARGQ